MLIVSIGFCTSVLAPWWSLQWSGRKCGAETGNLSVSVPTKPSAATLKTGQTLTRKPETKRDENSKLQGHCYVQSLKDRGAGIHRIHSTRDNGDTASWRPARTDTNAGSNTSTLE
ncbi:hypothetical protein K437DRAFT_258368 [Tilletiaria anomala UBC 951]|uniref:Uncharacterized protein n=1 Tax=Tilletiaria anomala (strain ATCC 24038 / CBS 436.72 / UBC 951) TaxID=1037660 RepID=A0A066VHB6_TILAU|nr:uncharacterized protein K437DRAFT_258368 [Tilletiaria anomala UBC 951]KDN41132.1 hypothetical protein K437DRAFT_258368 [Tilletiaria anomala UBC 951]